MYVEFSIPHIYFLSDISIVLRPVTVTLKFNCELVWRDFLNYLIIYIFLGVCAVILLGFNIIYFI